MHLKNNDKLKKLKVQYSVPGPRPVLAAPLRPHCVPVAGDSFAEVTVLSELPVPGLCPAGQCKNTTVCINPANDNDDLKEENVCLPQPIAV